VDRIIESRLLEWKNKSNRKPLILSGARQIGKSYSIKEFGRKHFEKVIEINFEKQRELHAVFTYNLDTERIVKELEILLGVEIYSGMNLLFFDEIQSCPDALKSLRYFYEDNNHIPLIAAGSLLDFEFRNISFPVGRIDWLNMYPMNFQEFLWACDKKQLWDYISDSDEIPEHIESLIYKLLDDYAFVGGMPEVVKSFRVEGDYHKVQKIQSDLIFAYENDFSKYQPLVNKDCLLDILQNLTRNIGSQVIYTKLSDKFSSVTVKKGVDVLSAARLLYKVENVNIAGLPLIKSGKQFKIIFSDIGLLTKMSGLSPADRIAHHNWTAHFRGILAEQFIGQELLVNREKIHFWTRTEPGANSEVDYIIVKEGKIIPVEVKAGNKGSLKSMHVLFEKYPHIEKGLVFSKAHSGFHDKIQFIPLYKVGMI
jgi:predicted AAA+ superfamily ATPase